jgi:hypothetical protein
VLGGGGEDLGSSAVDYGVVVVGVFTVAVGMAHDQLQGPVRGMDRARLLGPIIDDLDSRPLYQLRPVRADPDLGSPHAADHPVRGRP